MALSYYSQSINETFARKSPGATPAGFPSRIADTSFTLLGRSGRHGSELVYLRGQNASPQGVDEKDSDAWHKFATGKGVVSSRADQEEREFFIEKSFT